jgi:hypothetical protein
MGVPLSKREKDFLESKNAIRNGYIRYSNGMTLYKAAGLSLEVAKKNDPDGSYYKTAEQFGFPLAVSVSGTTDELLNFGCILGLNSKKEMEGLRLIALGYMITQRHHTAYEVMTSARAFEHLEVRPNSDYYKKILADRPDFINAVEKKYHELFPGKDLPTQLFTNCIVSEGLKFSAQPKGCEITGGSNPPAEVDTVLSVTQPILKANDLQSEEK